MSVNPEPVAVFRLGRIVTTANALSRLSKEDILKGIQRHQAGDWGDASPEGQLENEFALHKGLRVWSVYHNAKGVKFWIITEADRSATTVMLPEDY
jgi:hypothetical protein